MNYTKRWKQDAPDHWSRNERGMQLCVWPLLSPGYTWELFGSTDDDEPTQTGETETLVEAQSAADEAAETRKPPE